MTPRSNRKARFLLGIGLAIALVTPATAGTSPEFNSCQAAVSDTVNACNAALNSGRLTNQETFAAYRLIAMDYLQRGDKANALAAFDKMTSATPSDPSTILARALIYSNIVIVLPRNSDLRTEFINRAIDDWNAVQSSAPNTMDLYTVRASSLISWIQSGVQQFEGDPSALDKILDDINHLIITNNRNPSAYFLRGKFHLLGRWCHLHNGCTKDERAMAVDDFTHAIELDPKLDAAYEQRALAYASLNHFDFAIADLDNAIRAKPKADSYMARAVFHQRLGDMRDAVNDYSQAIQLEPKNPIPYQRRAELMRDHGDLKAAIADLKAAYDLNPNSTQIQRELADLMSREQ